MTVEQNSPLGKASAYIDNYDASLLFPIPRSIKRDDLGISAALPFGGVDIWNAFELSWLNNNGKPIVAIAEFIIPVTSPNLVESKSFKLYLNSLNQTKFASADVVQNILIRDLSATAGTDISVRILSLSDAAVEQKIVDVDAICIDDIDVIIPEGGYTADVTLLQSGSEVAEEKLVSHLLKSNCLVTGQPDWGSIVIHYRGAKINHAALLKYLISFRQHNEFHEQCVERIFVDLSTHCGCEELSVYARYVRRGGLDINPFRSNRPAECTPQNTRLVRQ